MSASTSSKSNLPRIVRLTLALGAIGVARDWLHVALGVRLDEKWFSLDADLLYTMFFYPIFLCFHAAMAADLLIRKFRMQPAIEPGRMRELLLRFFFCVQLVHLAVPFLDALALRWGLPWRLPLLLNDQTMNDPVYSWNPFNRMPDLWWLPFYFTPTILLFTRTTTFGINVAWLISTVAACLYFRRVLMMRWVPIAALLLALFQLIYWPVYKYYFVFDEGLRWLSSSPLFQGYKHWGYGTYFLVMGLSGAFYFVERPRRATA